VQKERIIKKIFNHNFMAKHFQDFVVE